MPWAIQIDWNGHWVTVDQGYKTRDDAEWATAKWKQANDCRGDPFRAVEVNEAQFVTATPGPAAAANPPLPFAVGQVVECVNASISDLTLGKKYEVKGLYRSPDGDFVGVVREAGGVGRFFPWRFKATTDDLAIRPVEKLNPDSAVTDLIEQDASLEDLPGPGLPTRPCRKCGTWTVGLHGDKDGPLCGVCAGRADRGADELRAKMLDPLYIPTLPEASTDPAGFVEGMTEETTDPPGGEG